MTSPTTNKTQQIQAGPSGGCVCVCVCVCVCPHRTGLMSIHDDRLFIILPCLFTCGRQPGRQPGWTLGRRGLLASTTSSLHHCKRPLFVDSSIFCILFLSFFLNSLSFTLFSRFKTKKIFFDDIIISINLFFFFPLFLGLLKKF